MYAYSLGLRVVLYFVGLPMDCSVLPAGIIVDCV